MPHTLPAPPPPLPPLSREAKLGLLGLILLVIAAYSPVFSYGYVLFDDMNHVWENPIVTGGLSFQGVRDAFTTFPAALWVPLTWLSFALDVSLFGLKPGAIHAVNLLYHLGATLFLFRASRTILRSDAGALVVAALFGLHPLNVESVAWIAERKNALSSFLLMPALHYYATYAWTRSRRAWIASLVWFSLALLAKPSVTPFPCALLLLDLWPFRRLENLRSLPRLVLEKVPFFLGSAITSVMTIHAQRGSIAELPTSAILDRLGYAAENYVWYLSKLVLPISLAPFYPRPPQVQPWEAIGALVVLLLITGWCLWQFRTRPWWLVGWLWFLGLLVPSIGIIQVGSTARADRFTYLPQIGLWLALGHTLAPLFARAATRLPQLLSGCTALALASLTFFQVGYWENSITLFGRSVVVTPAGNSFAWRHAGYAWALEGNDSLAVVHFQKALAIRDSDFTTWLYLGQSLIRLQRFAEALPAFQNAAGIDRKSAPACAGAAVALSALQRDDEARRYLEEAIRRDPGFAPAYHHLAAVLDQRGDRAAAIEILDRGITACTKGRQLLIDGRAKLREQRAP